MTLIMPTLHYDTQNNTMKCTETQQNDPEHNDTQNIGRKII